jgi:hypothetical protein
MWLGWGTRNALKILLGYHLGNTHLEGKDINQRKILKWIIGEGCELGDGWNRLKIMSSNRHFY